MRKIKLGNGIAMDSVWLTVAKLMTSLISIATTKLLAVEFSLADYGTYSQGLLILSTATNLSILGLSDGVNFFYNGCNDETQKRKNVNTTFFIQSIVGVLCAIIIMACNGPITAYFDNPALSGVYIYIMFMPLLANFLSMYQVLFVSIGKAKSIAIRNLVVSLAKFAAVATAALLTEDIKTIFLFTLITDILQIVYFALVFAKTKFRVNPFDFDKTKIKEILYYCVPLAVYILTDSLNRDIDKYIVSYFTDTQTLAVYTNAAKVLPFDMLTASFATVMFPVITKYVVNKEYEKSRDLYKNYLAFAYTTTWIIAFGAIVCSKELMLLLYDDKYLAGLSVFVVYIFVDMIKFANIAIILRAKGKTKALMCYSLSMLALNCLLNIMFFKLFGLIGPAIATLVVTFGMNVIMLIHGSKIIHCKLGEIIDFKDVLKLIVQLVVVGAFAYIIRWFCDSKDVNYFVTLLVSYGAYAVVLLALNIKKILRLFNNMNKIKAG